MKLQTSPALQTNNFSGSKKSFFRMPLVKSANSTSLPSFKLAPNYADSLQNKTKNALRIWGTLGLLWCKFACIQK